MTVGEIRKMLEPFTDEAVLLVKQESLFFPVVRSSYVHMAEGHPYLEIPKEPPFDES